jgi:putative glutamine amidotransferase
MKYSLTRFKKYLLLLFLASLICCTPATEQVQEEPFAEGEQYIILMHPTVANLRIFQYLTENNIFPLPDNYKAVGVYHSAGAYDYQLSYDFLAQEKFRHSITFLGLDHAMDDKTLFVENALTTQFRHMFDRSKGVIFFGGPDIPPSISGEPTHLLSVITDPFRHYLELSYLFHLLGGWQDETFEGWIQDKPDYRILGICLGMQTMNVATGGALIQDIPMQIYGVNTVEQVLALPENLQHRNYLTNLSQDRFLDPDSYHQIAIEPGSFMHRIAGDTHPVVLSSHHQSLGKLGKGWKVTAWCMDGKIPEAIEHEQYPNVLGVQFHPERIKIFNYQHLKKIPGVSSGKSYRELFPGERGEGFHDAFWKIVAGQYRETE